MIIGKSKKSFSDKKILIVEDGENSRRILKDFLEGKGFQIILAQNGQECMRKAIGEKPDIILLDLSIPVIDGWEAARLMKRNKATKSIPIIATTAHTLIGDREKALEAGCDDYVSKPINHEDLLLKIQDFLNQN